MALAGKHLLQLREHQGGDRNRLRSSCLDAVHQHTKCGGFAWVVTDENVDHFDTAFLRRIAWCGQAFPVRQHHLDLELASFLLSGATMPARTIYLLFALFA